MNHLVIFIFWPHVSPALVFQYLNIKLTDISVTDPEKYPHMVGLRSFIWNITNVRS